MTTTFWSPFRGLQGLLKISLPLTAYSHKDQWAGQLHRRAVGAGITAIDFFVFIAKTQILNP